MATTAHAPLTQASGTAQRWRLAILLLTATALLAPGLAYAQALLDQGRHAEAAASARDIVDMCDTLAAELAADHKKIQP